MSTLQAVIASISIPYGPPPAGPVGTLIWDGVPESYLRPTGGTDPVLTSLLMPDNSTTKDVHVFGGTDYISTPGHATGNFYFNIWFYPTSTDVGLMSEQGSEFENTSYYYNMLEINSVGWINASVWNGGSMTTISGPQAINLNAWNHLYFYFDGTNVGFVLNQGSEFATPATRSAPSTSYFAFGTNCSTFVSSNARFQGTLSDVVISSTTSGSNYDSTKSVYESPTPNLYSSGIDYASGQMGPSGAWFPDTNEFRIDAAQWTNSIGAFEVLNLTSGDTFTADINGTPTTITLTSTWTYSVADEDSYVSITASPTIAYSNITPMSIEFTTATFGANTFTVGDGKTVSITTSYGAAPHLVIVTNGARAGIASWTTTADLTRSGSSATVDFDIVSNPPNDNGDGTWTYDFYIAEGGSWTYPGNYSWDSVIFN